MMPWGLPCGESPKGPREPMMNKLAYLLGQLLALLFLGLCAMGFLVLMGIFTHLAFNVAYWGWRLI